MKIIPAVDILNGQVVRLRQGIFNQSTVYDFEPHNSIKKWLANGAELVHVVDLNGAKGESTNINIINKIVQEFAEHIQIAGGIKTLERADELLTLGAKRVVIGSAAAKKQAWVKELLARKPDQVVIALDVEGNQVRTNGWLDNSSHTLDDLLVTLQSWGAISYIVTDISRDGMRTGPNLALYKSILETNPNISLVASGGVCCNRDLELLRRIEVAEVIVGKALYTGEVVVSNTTANGGYSHDN